MMNSRVVLLALSRVRYFRLQQPKILCSNLPKCQNCREEYDESTDGITGSPKDF